MFSRERADAVECLDKRALHAHIVRAYDHLQHAVDIVHREGRMTLSLDIAIDILTHTLSYVSIHVHLPEYVIPCTLLQLLLECVARDFAPRGADRASEHRREQGTTRTNW